MKSFLLCALLVAGIPPSSAGELRTLDEFRAATTNATNTRAKLTLPSVPQTPAALGEAVAAAIREADAALDRIARQDAGAVTFQSTVVALDALVHTARTPANLAAFIQETHPDAAMRAAGAAAVKAHQDWLVGVDYREDVYQAIKRFADTRPTLTGEDARLLADTLRAYHRAGPTRLPPIWPASSSPRQTVTWTGRPAGDCGGRFMSPAARARSHGVHPAVPRSGAVRQPLS